MKAVCKTVIRLSIIFVIVICLGEPDILDGWIKRANAPECTASTSGVDHAR